MIKCLKEKITCPKCGFVYEHDCYAAADPTVRDKIIDGSAFLATCPGCGVTTRIIYPCLYQDAARSFGVYFLPQTQDRMVKCSGQLAEMTDPQVTVKRLTDDYSEFVEKLILFENNLDDYIMELFKAYTALSMMGPKGQAGGFVPEKLIFNEITGNSFLLTGMREGESKQISVPKKLYTELERRVDTSSQPEDYVMIDMLWALDTLRRQGSILDKNAGGLQ